MALRHTLRKHRLCNRALPLAQADDLQPPAPGLAHGVCCWCICLGAGGVDSAGWKAFCQLAQRCDGVCTLGGDEDDWSGGIAVPERLLQVQGRRLGELLAQRVRDILLHSRHQRPWLQGLDQQQPLKGAEPALLLLLLPRCWAVEQARHQARCRWCQALGHSCRSRSRKDCLCRLRRQPLPVAGPPHYLPAQALEPGGGGFQRQQLAPGLTGEPGRSRIGRQRLGRLAASKEEVPLFWSDITCLPLDSRGDAEREDGPVLLKQAPEDGARRVDGSDRQVFTLYLLHPRQRSQHPPRARTCRRCCR